MFPFSVYSRFKFGDMTAIFLSANDQLTFSLIPSGMSGRIPQHRKNLRTTQACRHIAEALDSEMPAYEAESLLQFKIAGDPADAMFAPGSTMRNSASIRRMKLLEQKKIRDTIVTRFEDDRHLLATHTIRCPKGAEWVEVNTTLHNSGPAPVKIEMLSSFSLGMLSPFQKADGKGKYKIHRFQSAWSAEGRHECRSAEECNLENSWAGGGMRSLRFGQRSSMPVKDFFPFAGFEDTDAGVVWGAQLAALGPWQMEISRFSDFFNLSGGQTDREFGGWTKILAPGETFEGPIAILSCVRGDWQDLMNRLVKWQTETAPELPTAEAALPVLFNDWCTTWGRPTSANLLPVVHKLRNHDIAYFVLDAGWFTATKDGLNHVGDWNVEKNNFPQGLSRLTGAVAQAGFTPGVWFEFENCTDLAKVSTRNSLLLKLDGMPIQSGSRRFLDFRSPEVWKYLDAKVVKMLKKYRFGYIKVDYNGAIGFGCDGKDSPPEELCKHLEKVQEFFQHLRTELPQLVIEVCASGGHRLTPAWARLCSMFSSTDAHEGVEIPIIAANVQMLIPMRASQIWATLRKDDDENRLYYSLSAAMIGRPCLSGDLPYLDERQSSIMFRAVEFYAHLRDLVLNGKSRFHRQIEEAWNEPEGYQVFTRSTAQERLVVIHTFEHGPEEFHCALEGKWEIAETFAPEWVSASFRNREFSVKGLKHFGGAAFLLRKK